MQMVLCKDNNRSQNAMLPLHGSLQDLPHPSLTQRSLAIEGRLQELNHMNAVTYDTLLSEMAASVILLLGAVSAPPSG